MIGTFNCFIDGDSIALMLAHVLKGCVVIAKVGVSSTWIAAHPPFGQFEVSVISSGSNDPDNPRLAANLAVTRQHANGKCIVWIIPKPKRAEAANRAIARAHGDGQADFEAAADGIHPKSETALRGAVLAAAIRCRNSR